MILNFFNEKEASLELSIALLSRPNKTAAHTKAVIIRHKSTRSSVFYTNLQAFTRFLLILSILVNICRLLNYVNNVDFSEATSEDQTLANMHD